MFCASIFRMVSSTTAFFFFQFFDGVHIHHMQKKIGLENVFQGGLEAFDQPMGDVLDKSDRIRQDYIEGPFRRLTDPELSGCCIQSREELVLNQDFRFGKPFQECRLT